MSFLNIYSILTSNTLYLFHSMLVAHMYRNHLSLAKRIPAHFKDLEASSLSSQAVQRILLDVSHLVAVLRRVRGLRDRGRTLDRYFRDRYVLCLI
mgnify:CR=1 FL=1